MHSHANLPFAMAWLLAAMVTLSAGIPREEPSSTALTTMNTTVNNSTSANLPTTFAQRVSFAAAEAEPVFETPEIFQEADITDFEDLPTNSRVMCDPVNWSEDHTTEDSPLAVDCLWLAYRLAAGNADWAIPGYVGGFRGIEHIGTCDIGCDAPNKAVRRAFVGNQDLINAIKHAML
ncbi:hypothetical protein GE09DRAFT_1261954 [Coniochaeta sp. 2T2.1]|nr:hypothetical protein GE09DRAFT_1261954 [Coniochaeta sp. 2T2.1]